MLHMYMLTSLQGMDLIRQLAFDPTRGKLHPAGSIRSGGADRAALGPRYDNYGNSSAWQLITIMN